MVVVDAVEPVVHLRAELGEGPVWDASRRCLFWVDIMRGLVHRYDFVTTNARTFEMGQPIGAVVPTGSDDLMVALRDGFGRLDLETGRVCLEAAIEANRVGLRMNDGKCDALGRFWAGSMAIDTRPDAGALYRLDPDGSVHEALTNVTISNGLDWASNNRMMYYVDSAKPFVDVFDFDLSTGHIANRRHFVHIPEATGTPDGLTVDSEDFVWVSLWGGGAIHRYAPDSTLDRIVKLPVSYPTSCVFGGPDLQDLYITSATIALSPSEVVRQPLAGLVFRCRPGITGRAGNRFANRV